jgi:sugar phosphate isomerase/epimerase
MKKTILLVMTLIIIAGILSVPGLKGFGTEEKVAGDQKVRIKKIPISVQCWTFRKFSFYETLDKAKELGVRFLQPYPGQLLSRGSKERFNHQLSDEQITQVKNKLKEHGISLVSYGVVGFDNKEADMKKVFDFARKLGIRTIVTEPEFDDFSLLDKMVKKYNINIAIHNHPFPSKYARPETVLEHVKGLDTRIGACADTGHWMRTGVDPVKALRMLEGRIIDVHLKDLNVFGKKNAYDVPFGEGKANIRAILAELTRQNYFGFLAVEHEKKEDIENPVPPIRKGLDYIKSVTYYQDYEEILSRSFRTYSLLETRLESLRAGIF